MAYIKKSGVSSKPKAEKLPYKGGSAAIEKLPYSGGKAEATPLKTQAKRNAASAVKGTVSGIGATVTKTNRATGETATKKKQTLTPTTRTDFTSTGKYKRIQKKK